MQFATRTEALQTYFLFLRLYAIIKPDIIDAFGNLSGISEEMSEEQLSLLDLLSSLNIESRYLMHKSKPMVSLTVERCETMIKETGALYQ